LLVDDEVQAGTGRTGKMWAIEYDGVEPDMLTWGKGMGGDMPSAGLTIRKNLAEKIQESSQPNTFAGNAVTAATTITNIEILSENDFELVKRAGTLGEKIKGWLTDGAKETRTIGDVRGRGLMIGIEVVKDKETKEPLDRDSIAKIVVGMLRRGMVMVPCGRYGNVFRFMPPLILTEKHAQKASEILLEAVKEVEAG
jgi:4-aminobutyrate aminotransferase